MVRDPPHILKPLKTTTTPKRFLWLDVQADRHTVGSVTELVWNCGAIGSTHWTSRAGKQVDEMHVYKDQRKIWEFADHFCTAGKRVVMFCFNLPEQIRTSGSMKHLPGLGWSLERVVLEEAASWALWKNGKKSLLMCDLRSWTPVEWERLKNSVKGWGHDIAYLDEATSTLASLTNNRACIVRAAVLEICEWIESQNLGSFKPTGSGQSYGAFRRRFMAQRILVHDDTNRLDLERLSMWAGRTEAWRHGRLLGGPFLELDMRTAYCRIAAQCEVPTIARSEIRKPTLDKCLAVAERDAVLAEVTIDTEIPFAPASLGNRVVWPVGQFNTVLWEPELQLAKRFASGVQVRRAYRYTRAPALQPFATWVLSHLDNSANSSYTIPSLVLKHWSRCLVGRLALRYRSWVHYGYNNDPELSMVTYIDPDEQQMTDMLLVGNDMLLLAGLEESPESVPQIPGWIMSECRRRLWDTMIDVGIDRIVYVDTDSVIIDTRGSKRFANDLIARYKGLWAPKAQHRRMVIHGPRNIELDSDRRISGLPLSARQVGPLEFRGEVMRSVKESMRHGQLDRVITANRRFVFDAPDLRRGHNKDGSTFPFRIGDTCTQDIAA